MDTPLRIGSKVTSASFSGRGSIQGINGAFAKVGFFGGCEDRALTLPVSDLVAVRSLTDEDLFVKKPFPALDEGDVYSGHLIGIAHLGEVSQVSLKDTSKMELNDQTILLYRCFDRAVIEAIRGEDTTVSSVDVVRFVKTSSHLKSLYRQEIKVANPDAVWQEIQTTYYEGTEEVVSTELVGAMSPEMALGSSVYLSFRTMRKKTSLRTTTEIPREFRELPLEGGYYYDGPTDTMIAGSKEDVPEWILQYIEDKAVK